jgi:rhodanese-related sulfurtransferase
MNMQTVTVEELNAKLAEGENIHLVDVREQHERADFNIGGLHLPFGNIQTMQIEELEDWKNEPIYVYCRSGNRSGQACLILETAGFSNLINVTGGMLAWQERIKD